MSLNCLPSGAEKETKKTNTHREATAYHQMYQYHLKIQNGGHIQPKDNEISMSSGIHQCKRAYINITTNLPKDVYLEHEMLCTSYIPRLQILPVPS